MTKLSLARFRFPYSSISKRRNLIDAPEISYFELLQNYFVGIKFLNPAQFKGRTFGKLAVHNRFSLTMLAEGSSVPFFQLMSKREESLLVNNKGKLISKCNLFEKRK